MMLETDIQIVKTYIGYIKEISHILDIKERRHQAWDIRQNIRWNGWIDGFKTVAAMWEGLAVELESSSQFDVKESLPKRKLSPCWFAMVEYCLKYILHSHTYASGYADDVLRLYPMMNDEQRFRLSRWLSSNVCDSDDLACRKLTAFFDPANRYFVSASATSNQIKDWAKRNGAICCDDPRPIDVQDVLCFCFNGDFISVDHYLKLGETAAHFVNEFITSKTCVV